MSIESEILRIQHNIADTYAAVADKGGEVPLQPKSANLAAAVASIPAGGDTAFLVKAPIGTIVVWSGAADNVPDGWHICDGTEGTPDLSGRFVLGANDTHTVGSTGGSEEVTLTKDQMPSHTHTIPYNKSGGSAYSIVYLEYTANGSNRLLANDAIGKAGADQHHPNMPPYYALCYIMKL